MEYSKEDFGYFFAGSLEDEEKSPLAGSKNVKASNEVVVAVDEEQHESNEVPESNVPATADVPTAPNHANDVTPKFSKGELDFKLLTPRELDHKAFKKAQAAQAQFLCSCCYCFAFIMTWIGALLVFVSNRGEFEDSNDEEIVFFTGSGILFVSCCCWTIACFTCCGLCVSLCGGESLIGDKDKVDLKPHQDFEIKLERWNDKYEKADVAMLKHRFHAFAEAFTAVPGFSNTNKGFFKMKDELHKVQKAEVGARINGMLGQGLSPELVARSIRPTCFRIAFKGDMMVSNINSFREQISTAIKLGMPGLDVVVVVLSSPGGAVSGYGLAASQLVRVKNAGLKLLVCVDSIAASGGYMMASVANEIYAAPFALVGSIGVISIIPNIEGLLNEHKIETNVLTSGEYKNTVNVVGPITEEGRKKHLEDLEKIHQAFKHHIVLNRPKLAANIDDIGTGEAFLAVEARKLGLVDHIKTSDELFEELGVRYEIINLRVKSKTPFPHLSMLSRHFSFANALMKVFGGDKKETLTANAQETQRLLRDQSPVSYLV